LALGKDSATSLGTLSVFGRPQKALNKGAGYCQFWLPQQVLGLLELAIPDPIHNFKSKGTAWRTHGTTAEFAHSTLELAIPELLSKG
jgi:hypothetical protein